MTTFDIGNIYSTKNSLSKKTYYIAIRHQTLITCKNGKFGKYTTKKSDYMLENSMPVSKLCKLWKIKMRELDSYMSEYFSPDEEAINRARKEKDS